MHLLPAAERGKQLDVIALIAVFLRRVYIVRYTSGLLLEAVGEYRIYPHHHLLLGMPLGRVKHHFGKMAILEMIEIVTELAHLAPQTVRLAILGIDTGVNSVGRQHIAYLLAKLSEAVMLQILIETYHCRQLLKLMRTAEFQTEILKFGLDIVESESIGERSVEVIGLTRYLHLLVRTHRVERAHIMETVGKFDKQCSYIILHRVEHLLVVVHLLGLVILVLLLLGDHLDQKCHIMSEACLNILDSMISVLDHIVQECRYHRIGIKHQLFGTDRSHGYGMQYVRFAGLTLLRCMRLTRHLERILDTDKVLGRHPRRHCIEYGFGPLFDNLVIIYF